VANHLIANGDDQMGIHHHPDLATDSELDHPGWLSGVRDLDGSQDLPSWISPLRPTSHFEGYPKEGITGRPPIKTLKSKKVAEI